MGNTVGHDDLCVCRPQSLTLKLVSCLEREEHLQLSAAKVSPSSLPLLTVNYRHCLFNSAVCLYSLSVYGQWLSVDVWDCGYSRWQLPVGGLLSHGSGSRRPGAVTGGQWGRGGGRVRQFSLFAATSRGHGGGSPRQTLFQRRKIKLLLFSEHIQHLQLQVRRTQSVLSFSPDFILWQ